MQGISMLMGIWEWIGNIVSGFFAIIPQTMYFIFASAASVIDLLQYVVRKLAGLDVYYVNGQPQSGDIISRFIEGALGFSSEYSVLSTVFYAMVIFGVVLLVFSTIIAIIRAHYDYDAKKSPPMVIVGKAIKGLLTMVIIPITTIFSLYLSNALLKALDTITSGSNSTQFLDVYESSSVNKLASSTKNDREVYSTLNVFWANYYTDGVSFSSTIFASSAHTANRVRANNYAAVVGETNGNWSNAGIFWTNSNVETKEIIAQQIDTAFQYGLTLEESVTLGLGGDASSLITSYSGMSAIYAIGLINVSTFSKFNVGLVWYYYNLWTFNYLIGFAGILTALTIFVNIILGLISRLFMSIALFLVYPPIVGLFPFDDGNGVKSWRTNFTKTFISVFGTIVAINILSIILPFLQNITLFNNILLDNIMNSLFVIAGLLFVKKAIALMSTMIGAENIEELGGKMAKDFQGAILKGMDSVMKVAGVGIAAGKSLRGSINRRKNSRLGKKIAANRQKRKEDKAVKKRLGLDVKPTDEHRELYKKFTEADRKKEVEEKAKKLMESDKNSDLTKSWKQREYRARARRELEKTNPELFKKNEKGNKVIADRKAYNKLIADKEKELAMEDARKELDSAPKTKTGKIKNWAQKITHEAPIKPNRRTKRGNAQAESGNIPKPKLKHGVEEFVDISKSSIKLAGDLTGIGGLIDAIKKSDVAKSFSENLNAFTKAAGIVTPGYQSAKDKEREKETKIEQGMKRLRAEASNIETTTSQIESLTKLFETYSKTKLSVVEEAIKKEETKLKRKENQIKREQKKEDEKPRTEKNDKK